MLRSRPRLCRFGSLLALLTAAALPAVVLFLNYRPRSPHPFSTLYGDPYTTAQMVDAICALRGQGLRGKLALSSVSGHFPDGVRRFELPSTGETFNVSEETCQVVAWWLGRYEPPLGVPPAPTEAYHRALLRRYYSAVPTARMQPEASRLPSRGTFRYVEVTADGRAYEPHRVVINWNAALTRVERVLLGAGPPPRAWQIRVSLLQARQRALDRAYEIPGLQSVAVGTAMDDQPALFATADELGVPRCYYAVLLQRMRWRPDAHPQKSCGCDAAPECDTLLVDAETGVAVPMMYGPAWEVEPLRRRLRLTVAGNSLTFVAYPPLRRGLHAYLCGEYLQSKLWAGEYTVDERSGAFTVRDRGRCWQGRRGSPFLRGPEGLSMCWTAPRMIDGELHLPAQMLERITGWSVRWRGGELQVRPPRGV